MLFKFQKHTNHLQFIAPQMKQLIVQNKEKWSSGKKGKIYSNN